MSKLGKEEVEVVKTTAKQAPKITFEDVFVDDRSRIAEQHHKENPDYRYSWVSSADAQAGRIGKYKEVVKGVEHGNDVLVRMPMDIYAQVRGIEAERSLQMTAKNRGAKNPDEEYKTGNLRQFVKERRKKE